jgi:cell wall integrity and stress response component
MYQSTGYCGEQCTGAKQAVMALTNGNDCWCGAELPSDDDKVDDSKCSTPCTGYGQDNCTFPNEAPYLRS